jgi:hypothetical protein
VQPAYRRQAHRNLIEIAVRCTLYLSFNSHSTNIWLRCTNFQKLYVLRFKNRGDLVANPDS